MKRLPFEIHNRHGSVLAAFAHETDAKRYAEERAARTFQTPPDVIKVVSMLKTTKAPNGRLVGEVFYEFETKSSAEGQALFAKSAHAFASGVAMPHLCVACGLPKEEHSR